MQRPSTRRIHFPSLIVAALAFGTALSLSAQYTTDHTVGSWTAPEFESINGLRTFDVDGDGDQDIFLNRNLSIQGTFSWYENTGMGVFAPPVTLHSADQSFPDVARDFDLADADADGDLDLVYVTELSSNIYVRTFDAGAFGPPEVWGSLAANGRFIRWMHLNPWDDSLLDVVAHSAAIQPSGLYNTGGAFGTSFVIGSGQAGLGPNRLEVGAFTDNYGDFVVHAGSLLHRYTQVDDGNGGYEWTMTVIGYCDGPFQVLDVDNDGDDDIGLAHDDTTAWLRSPGYLTDLEYEVINPASAYGTFGKVDCDQYTDLFSLFYTDFDEPQISTGFDSNGFPNVTQPSAASGLPNTGRFPQVLADFDEDGLNDLLMVVDDTTLHWYANDGPEPSVISIPPLDTLCAMSSGYVLPSVAPPGGTWSGQGVDDGVFSAVNLLAGDIPLLYETSDTEGCAVSGTTTVHVIYYPTFTSTPRDECTFIPVQFEGSPAGGEWTGLADSTGLVQLTPGLSGGVQYNFIDVTGGSCMSLGAAIIDMSFPTVPNIGYGGPYCLIADEYQMIPVLVGNPGNMSIYSWVDSVDFITPGVANIYYLADTLGLDTLIIGSSRPGFCSSVDTVIIEVVAPPEVTLAAFTDTLANTCGNTYALSGGLPAGGVYSGDGVTYGDFAPAGLLGDVDITYTYTDGDGCSGSATQSIHVIDGISVTPNFVQQCVSDVPIQLTVVPQPEVWFDAIVSSGNVLNTAQPFSGSVYCAWTDVTGCQLYGTLSLDLRAYSEGYVTSAGLDPVPAQVCLSTDPFEITASLSDGSAETISFDPQAEGLGDYQYIGFAVDDGSGCLRNDTLTFSVVYISLITVQEFPDTLLNVCPESEYPLADASPAGGTWSGPGVVNGIFHPENQFQDPTLVYTVDLGEGCVAADSAVIHVIGIVPFTPAISNLYRCIGDDPVQFSTVPAGGVWTAPATPDGYVDMLTPHDGILGFTYTDAAGCSAGLSIEAVISPYVFGIVTIPDSAHVVCEDHPAILVSWSLGNGSMDQTLLDPAISGPGTYFFTGFPQTQPGPTQCYQTVTDSILVLDTPVALLDLGIDTLYTNGVPVELVGGTPPGGVFSGDSVTDGFFDPAAAGFGWHVITYTFDDGACAGEATDSIFVDSSTGLHVPSTGAALQVWPVPAQDLLQITLPAHAGMIDLVLVDARGRIVLREPVSSTLSGRTVTLGTNSLAHGTYTLFARGLANASPARIIIAR